MASVAMNSGVPSAVVQRMGNWKTPAMVDRYAHLADESLRHAAHIVDTAMGPDGEAASARGTDSK